MLASGGPGTIGSAAESIASTGITDPEVLDLTAQVLADIHLRNVEDHDYAETTSWLCKALGNSGNGRYKALLDEVSALLMSRARRRRLHRRPRPRLRRRSRPVRRWLISASSAKG